jgi:hypothetical protein
MILIHNLFKLLLISVLCISATAALAAKQPDWLNGNSSEYPNEQYLVGRGVGSTEAEAQDRARGDLATIFEVRVQVSNEMSTTVANSGNKEQVNKFASQQVSAKTDKVISGITIAQIWRDPAMDFHALAVLSRSQASASLQEELSKIDDELKQQTQAASAETDSLLKVGALSKALQSSIKREGFQAMLKVVDPSGRGVQAPISMATIQQQIDQAIRKVRIAAAHPKNADSTEFTTIAKGGLAAAGFLSTKLEDADLYLYGTLDMVDLGRRDGWNWMRATLSVTLAERESGRVRGHKIWPVKASAQDPVTARSRAMMEVNKIFKQELRAAIIDFAVNPESSN